MRQLAHQGQPNNAMLDVAGIDQHGLLEAAAGRSLRNAADRLGWSGRRLHRCLKLARTIADLAGSDPVTTAHVAEFLQLRHVLG